MRCMPIAVDHRDVTGAVPAVVGERRRRWRPAGPDSRRTAWPPAPAGARPSRRRVRPGRTVSSSTSRVITPVSGSPTQPGRRSPSARVLSVISDSVVPYRSTGRCPVSSASPLEHRHRQRPRCPTPAAAPAAAPRRGGTVADDPRPHRRHAEVQRAARARIRLGRRLAGVDEPIADPQRTEQPEHQPVHMEQRKPVHQMVVGRPLPRLRQCVEVGGERAPAQHDALRRPGGARGVHDQCGRRPATAPDTGARNGRAGAPGCAEGPPRRRAARPTMPARPSR